MLDISSKSTENTAAEVIAEICAACAELDEQLRTLLRDNKRILKHSPKA